MRYAREAKDISHVRKVHIRAEQRVGEFNLQDLANTVWAYAVAGEWRSESALMALWTAAEDAVDTYEGREALHHFRPAAQLEAQHLELPLRKQLTINVTPVDM